MGGLVATEREGNLGRALRTVFEGGAAAGLTDAQLVDRVAGGGEPARTALAALVGAAWPDGPPRLPRRGPGRARRGRRLPGRLPRAGPQGGLDPRVRDALALAARRRAPDDGRGPGRLGPPPRPRPPTRRVASAGAATDPDPDDLAPLIHEELGQAPRSLSVGAGPLRPRRPLARGGRAEARLARRDGQEPPGPGPREAPGPPDPPGRRAGHRARVLGDGRVRADGRAGESGRGRRSTRRSRT